MYYMSSVHSPDGSYTEDPSTETVQFKSRSTEFDDEFDDEEPLPTIGTCKALYPFEGSGRNILEGGAHIFYLLRFCFYLPKC